MLGDRGYAPSRSGTHGAVLAPPRLGGSAMVQQVTLDNFSRAETDMYFGALVEEGGFGHFFHHRDVMSVHAQDMIRANRDTLYSAAVFDLRAGPVKITLPDPGKRFMSMQIIDEEQYALKVVYRPGTYTLDRKSVPTRYVMVAVRILVDPRDRADVARVNALQDAITVEQKHTGRFEIPDWDGTAREKIHDALLVLGEAVPDMHAMFGPRDRVDPVRHLVGTAMAWGGNPEHDATYLNVVPARNDGRTAYRLVVKKVPVDGFWSVSVYNAKGYFEPNEHDLYSVNNITAKKGKDGAVTIQFGGEPSSTNGNWLPIAPGWNYTVRLYRPRTEILEGRWQFPEAVPLTA
jgi:hypothetical protein